MQLAPIAPVRDLSSTAAAAPIAAPTPASAVPAGTAYAAPLAPAPASAPAAIAAANDGAARLETTPAPVAPPLVDFPGIVAGDQFKIVKGSKVGFLGVKGDAKITTFTPDAATFHVKAGAFGIKVDVEVEVVQTGPGTVRITSRGTGVPNMSAEGRILESRTNFLEVERIDAPDEHTVIRHDGAGNIVIDTVIPTFGDAHMVLDKQD